MEGAAKLYCSVKEATNTKVTHRARRAKERDRQAEVSNGWRVEQKTEVPFQPQEEGVPRGGHSERLLFTKISTRDFANSIPFDLCSTLPRPVGHSHFGDEKTDAGN